MKSRSKRARPFKIFIRILSAILLVSVMYGVLSLVLRPNPMPQVAPKPVATVFMNKNGIIPAEIILKKGQSVEFINNSPGTCSAGDASCNVWPASDPEPSHANYPEFDPKKPIAPAKSWIFVFNKVGNWGFHDHLWPKNKGVIRVIE